jgi:hypothetical protein
MDFTELPGFNFYDLAGLGFGTRHDLLGCVAVNERDRRTDMPRLISLLGRLGAL